MLSSHLISRVMWPAVFSEPIEAPFMPDANQEQRHASALAAQLTAWGCCHIEKPPENFGHMMIKLGQISGCYTDKECLEAAKRMNPSPAEVRERNDKFNHGIVRTR